MTITCPMGARYPTKASARTQANIANSRRTLNRARAKAISCACGGFHVHVDKLDTLRRRNTRARRAVTARVA